MFAQHIYQDQYLLTAQRISPAGATITANPICVKRVGDGSTVWCWNDRFNSSEAATIFDYNITTAGDWLLYNYGPRSYCINQQTGQTIWRKEWGGGISNMLTTTSLGTHFYFTGTPPELYTQKRFEESLYQGDLASGTLRLLASLPTLPGQLLRDPSGYDWIGRGRRITPTVVGADTLLLVSHDLPDTKAANKTTSTGYLSLYNLRKRSWVYERMPLLLTNTEEGVGNYSIIAGGKVYLAINMWVGCFELMTGKRLWMKRLTDNSLFSDLMLTDGKLLANGQDAKLYCLDPQTGATLWTQQSSGIGSKLYSQAGVVYYIASKDLLATDLMTGRLLWKLDCPDSYTENRSDSWFMGFVTGQAGQGGRKGRIYASTNLNVYCFEAAQ